MRYQAADPYQRQIEETNKWKGNIFSFHTMKACRGSRGQLHPLLTSSLDGGEWTTLCTRCLNPGKEPRYPLNRKLGGPQSWSGRFEEETNPFRLEGIEIRTVEQVA